MKKKKPGPPKEGEQSDWIGGVAPVNSIEGKKAAEELIKRLPPARRLVFDAVKAAGLRGTYGLALAEALNKPRDSITPRLHELWTKDHLITPVPDAHNPEKVFRAVYLDLVSHPEGDWF